MKVWSVALGVLLVGCNVGDASELESLERPPGDAGSEPDLPSTVRIDLGADIGPPLPPAVDAGTMSPGDAGPPTPCVNTACTCGARTGVRACRSDGTLGCCRCSDSTARERFDCLADGMVGLWQGTVTTPWGPAYRAQLELRADGTYATTCSGECNATFYYGTDGDGDGRRYELLDLTADERGVGRLRVAFRGGARQWGSLEAADLSADENRLRFEFWNVWARGRYGPVELDLTRQPSSP